MRSKIVTAGEAIALICDGDTLASTGFVQTGFTEALLSALEHCFLTTGSPRNPLTDICYENHFFDQAHFIKDFKQFTGDTPENFKRFL